MMQDPVPQPAAGPRDVRPAAPQPAGVPTLVGLLILLLAIWLLPPLVENVEFALVRGRERAQVEVARAQLAGHEAFSFAQVSEQVAKSIGPSVVHIDTVQGLDVEQDDLSAMLFGGRPQQRLAQGQGSGVIIDADGYVLTNNHVVEGASEMTVSLSDGRKVTAELMGGDPLTDLAVLKIDADGLIAAPWGDSDTLPVGAPVWAVGNPYGLDRSVTFGIISAKSRRGFGATPRIRSFCKPMPRSIPATAAGRWSTRRARWSASTPRLSGRNIRGSVSRFPATPPTMFMSGCAKDSRSSADSWACSSKS